MTVERQEVSKVSASPRWIRGMLLLFIVGLYVVALLSPAVYSHGFGGPSSGSSGGVWPGYEMVFKLPMAMMGPSWWANPTWLLGVIALGFGKCRWAIFFGAIATGLAALVLLIGAFPPDPFELSHLYAGYYFWLSSMVALLTAAIFLWFNTGPLQKPSPGK